MRTLAISLGGLMLLVGPSEAQQRPALPDVDGQHCAGQYECVEDRPLSSAEAERSVAYPARRRSVEQQTSAYRIGVVSSLAGAAHASTGTAATTNDAPWPP
jgi:hypothetical protein